MRARLLLLVVATAAAASAGWALTRPEAEFPHERHEGLFPLCVGCHEGIESGEASRVFPDPASCLGCHDGERLERVDWPGPTERASTLRFSHTDHASRVRSDTALAGAAGCGDCHAVPGATGRMQVRAAAPEACLGCHAHEASEHLALGRDCRQCHLPLAEAAGVPVERIAGFPRPPDHEAPGYLTGHDPGADVSRCATCHARESCARCHLNGAELAPVRALQPDARVATLAAALAPEYPAPASHADRDWVRTHAGPAGADAASCANCHTRASCVGCHADAQPRAVALLPNPDPSDPRGIATVEAVVHDPGFARAHAGAAALEGETCAGCHAVAFCESCHDGPASPSFHMPNYVERHGPEAYGRETECTACHTTEVFCRGCHVQSGLGSGGNITVAFHSSRPFWLLGHAAAARQGLEGCVTCHTQGDCAQCHSAVGGWRVNPHGPGFDPGPAREANPFSCFQCHRSEIPR